MKTRESGIPNESMWESFFDPVPVLEKMCLNAACRNIVDFGCGYGTFTIPAAHIVSGTVFAIDIEQDMIEAVQARADRAGLTNIRICLKDFMTEGSGLADASVDYAMLFNILHCEQPLALLEEAYRVLVSGGIVGIVHWNYDASTPRGPSMDIRPRPEQCKAWAEDVGFQAVDNGFVDLPPYHYGLRLEKPEA